MGLAPEKASTEIPGQSISEKLILVPGLIPDLLDGLTRSAFADNRSGIGWCLLRVNLYNLGREIRTDLGLYNA